jgi:hypothetical protein
MEVKSESSTEEIKRLRRCINDLLSILALPGTRTGAAAPRIVGNLLDALASMLSLDFRLCAFKRSYWWPRMDPSSRNVTTPGAGPLATETLADSAVLPSSELFSAEREITVAAALAGAATTDTVRMEDTLPLNARWKPAFPAVHQWHRCV